MNRLIALALLLAGALSAAVATAADPPELRLPKLKPTVLDSFAKSGPAVDPNVAWLKVPDAWKLTRGEGVALYVGDTGLDDTHPEFAGLKTERKNYTTDPLADKGLHGTHVAATVTGQKEVTGVAPRVAKLVSHKVLGDNGSGQFAWMTASIRDAMKEPGVYNASLGSGPSAADPERFDPAFLKAIREGIEAGMIFVFAGGNDGPGADTCGFPARFAEVVPGLVVVAAASWETSLVADFSSRGKAVSVTGPGVKIVSAIPGGKYAEWDGTSMAAPHIAGVACLWLSVNQDVPKHKRQERFSEWLRSASTYPTERHPARGYGRPDVSKLTGTKPPDPVTPPAEKVYLLNVADLQRQGYTAIRFDLGVTAGTSTQPIPVASFPPPQFQPAPVVIGQPAPTWSGYSAAPVYAPPPVIYHPVPTCGPGGCQPQQQYLFAPFGGRFR